MRPNAKRLLVGAGLGLAFLDPVLAEDAVLQLVATTSNVIETQIAIGVPALATEIRLRNTAPGSVAGVRRLRTSELFIRTSDGKSTPVTWERKDAVADPLQLRPGEDAMFGLTGTLSEPGVYETWIEATPIADGGGAASVTQRVRVVVTRTADALPAEFLAEPKSVGLVWGGWSAVARTLRLSESGADAMLLTLRNSTTEPVEFAAPGVISFSMRSNDVETAVAAAGLPNIDAADCVSPLAAGKACAVKLRLDDGLWPGEYRIGVGVAGAGGGWSEREQIVLVRASAVIAFLVVVAGALCGWYVNFWRASGRRALTGLIDTTRLKEKLQRLDAGATDAGSRRLLARTLTGIDAIETAIRKGADPTEDLTRLDAHISRLAAAIEIHRGRILLSPAGQVAMEPGWTVLIGLLEIAAPSEVEKARLEERLKTFAADVTEWPRLEELAASASTLAASVEALQHASGADVDPGGATSVSVTLQTAVVTARASLPDNTSVAARRLALVSEIDTARAAACEYFDTSLAALRETVAALSAAGSITDPALQASIAELNGNLAAVGSSNRTGMEIKQRLADLTDLWEHYRRLAFEADPVALPKMTSEAVIPSFKVAGVPAVDMPVAVTLPPTGSSLQVLERSRRRNERLTNLLILIVTGLGGVLGLWAASATWGSVADVITAFFAGMAAHVVIGEAVTRS